MILQLMAALTMGSCIGALTLWYTGFRAQAALVPSERLNRLNGGDAPTSKSPIGSIFNLRKRTNLKFGGITFGKNLRSY